jgi:hypothetical protein
VLHFTVEPRSGYLYTGVTGDLTVAAAQDALRELFGAAARQGEPRMLIDVSRLNAVEWGPQERYEVGAFIAAQVEGMRSLFSENPRIAIYAVAPLMDPNRFTQRVAVNRGAQVRASDSLQELLSWLGAKAD